MGEIWALWHLGHHGLDHFVHDVVSTSYEWLFVLGAGALLGNFGFNWRRWALLMNEALKTKMKRGTLVTVILAVLFFLWGIAQIIYEDHVTDRNRIVRLKKENADLVAANATLDSRFKDSGTY